jgi:predicted nucleic acid-binding protein
LRELYKSIEEHFELISKQEIKMPIIVKAELIYGIEKSKLKERNRNIYEKFIRVEGLIPRGSAAVINVLNPNTNTL